MRNLLLGLILTMIVLLETSVLSFFPIFGIQLSPLLVVILSLNFLGLGVDGYYAAFFGGLLLDLLADQPLGFSSCALVLISGAVGFLGRRAEGSLPTRLLITFGAAVIFRLVQSFPVIEPALIAKGGLGDGGLMLLVYPCGRYFWRNFFARREIEVGT